MDSGGLCYKGYLNAQYAINSISNGTGGTSATNRTSGSESDHQVLPIDNESALLALLRGCYLCCRFGFPFSHSPQNCSSCILLPSLSGMRTKSATQGQSPLYDIPVVQECRQGRGQSRYSQQQVLRALPSVQREFPQAAESQPSPSTVR